MMTIEISEAMHADIEKVRAELDPSVAELFIILLLTFAIDKSPENFEAHWGEIKKHLPQNPIWDEWAKNVENLTGPIRKLEGVMGGAACIGNTRIPIWALVSLKKQGMNDGDLLRAYPSLQASDLEASWSYYTVHSDEVDAVLRAQTAEAAFG